MSLPEAASQSLAVLSALAVRIRAPSGLNATFSTASWWSKEARGSGSAFSRCTISSWKNRSEATGFSGSNLIARQKSDSFSPLSQLELSFGLVEACPARLPQLFLQLSADLCFRFQRSGHALALVLSPEPLKPGEDS